MVRKWSEIDAPWFEVDGFADLIVSQVSIIDVLDLCNIEYYQCRTGDFTHKVRCPFKIHSDGAERTPSCYVSHDTNSFYCFGCNSRGNIIDFLSRYLGCPYAVSLEKISVLMGISSKEDIQRAIDNLPKREKRDPEKTMAYHVFKIGNMVREYLDKMEATQEYNKKLLWADKKIFPKLDAFLDEMSDDDWEKAKEFYDKIKNLIGEK